MNSLIVMSQVAVNNVMHSQSLWRGQGNLKYFFMVKWKKKKIVLDQSEHNIFNECNILLIINKYKF